MEYQCPYKLYRVHISIFTDRYQDQDQFICYIRIRVRIRTYGSTTLFAFLKEFAAHVLLVCHLST